MTNAQAKTYRDENRSYLFGLLEEEFAAGKLTALEMRKQEAEIEETWPE